MNWICVTAANPLSGLAEFRSRRVLEKAELDMGAKLYVGNLSKATTQDELHALFTQAGTVASAEVITDSKSGESQGFAFITMSAQSEAEKAISMFTTYSLNGHDLKVSMSIVR